MTQQSNVFQEQLGGALHQALVDLRLQRYAGQGDRLYCETDLAFAAMQPNEERRRFRIERVAQFVSEAATKIETEALSLVRNLSVDPKMAERMAEESKRLVENTLSGTRRYRPYLETTEPDEVGKYCVKLNLTFAVVGTSPQQPLAKTFLYYSLSTSAWSRNPGPSQRMEYRKLLDSMDSTEHSLFML
jgi:hypothetical protein